MCAGRFSSPWAAFFLGIVLSGCSPTPSAPSRQNQVALTNVHPAVPATQSNVVVQFTPTPTDAETRLHDEGSEAMDRGEYQLAADRFQDLIRLKPDDEEAYFNLGYALSRLNRSAEAIRSYEKCLSILPEYAEAHNNLGNLLLADRKFDQAALHFRIALTNQPESSIARNNLGKVFAVQAKPHEAIPFFRDAIQHDPKNWDARHNLAVAYLAVGQLEESRAELLVIVEENPGMPRARATLAKVQSLLSQKQVGNR